MRFWISWIQRTDDYRPLTFPPNAAILGYWCSGYDSDDNAKMSAAVEAYDALRACLALFREWPEAEDDMLANGCGVLQYNDDWRPSDRFPISDWMEERFK